MALIVNPFAKRDRETAWLIERSQPSSPKYWTGAPALSGDAAWSDDHQKAVRFARRVDAQRTAAQQMLGAVRVCEHVWMHRS